MTPHPHTTWTQTTISAQREVVRRRRRRIVAHLLASSLIGGEAPTTPLVPGQRHVDAGL
jgi:hypothetical protein